MMDVTNLIKTIETLAPDMEISLQEVQKGNAVLTGIEIGKGNIRPIVYVKQFEELYEESGYIAVANEIISFVEKVMNYKSSLGNIDEFMTYEFAKDNLRLCIAPKGTNKDCVVYPYLDLEIYIRVIVNNEASYKVKMEMLDNWGITKKELLNQAKRCTKPLYTVESIGSDEFPIFVARTKDEVNGPSIMCCKGILKETANKLNDDLVIVPSSIHECLLVPLSNMTPEEIMPIINDVNENSVEPEEVLSDHAYVFHRDTMEITW